MHALLRIATQKYRSLWNSRDPLPDSTGSLSTGRGRESSSALDGYLLTGREHHTSGLTKNAMITHPTSHPKRYAAQGVLCNH